MNKERTKTLNDAKLAEKEKWNDLASGLPRKRVQSFGSKFFKFLNPREIKRPLTKRPKIRARKEEEERQKLIRNMIRKKRIEDKQLRRLL